MEIVTAIVMEIDRGYATINASIPWNRSVERHLVTTSVVFLFLPGICLISMQKQHFDIPISTNQMEENVRLERLNDANIHSIGSAIQQKLANNLNWIPFHFGSFFTAMASLFNRIQGTGAYLCPSKNKPPCELAISRDIAN